MPHEQSGFFHNTDNHVNRNSHPRKNRDRDLSECERESALAGAGDKRQVFDKCMKARGY